ncbi:TetR/AcrR family transcriptional regulator [Gordonia hydrophobica]|uniref:TetR/AcrR family transcriptional regulator n=1 Tax=Gordonia hydrophobica TaxID=40516 RepID=A0ABZ2TWF7_9ACTN|nr:TetR/AcrR family transcriptional regulator [Gordonia hydrophobica]MBM7365774.1 AcrR family transcriptional regulator [Gordonia hydrophobica]
MGRTRSGTKGVPRAHREDLILDAAGYEFGTRGFAAANVADIAVRAGISKPLVYGYFDSKDGLFAATCRRAGERVTTAIDEAMAAWGEVRVDRGAAVMEAIFSALAGRPHEWNVIFDRTVPGGTESAAVAAEFRERLVKQSASGIEASYGAALSDPRDLSALVYIWTATVGALVEWWIRNPESTSTEMVARTARILGALQTPPTRP